MTKRIFRAIFLGALLALLASSLITLMLLYRAFTDSQTEQTYAETQLIAQGVSRSGIAFFDGLRLDDDRVTWIDETGAVLYDTNLDAKEMENHADREEVREALASGQGESTRFSTSLLKEMHYTAKRLEDGTVIRLSHERFTWLAYSLMTLQPVLIILLFALGLSVFLASRLSREIVKPLNRLNLETPLSNDTYEELSPLLTRLEVQRRQINQQLEMLQRRQVEFSAIMEHMNEGLIILNEKSAILSINNSAAKLFKTDQSCLGHDMLTVERSFEMQKLLQTAFAGQHADTVLQHEKGSYQVTASPVVDGDQLVGIVLLTVDITEKVLGEKMRREFTANVSHELKTPLQSISGCAEIIRNGLVKPEDKPRFIWQIYDEAQRLIALVEDIIRLSQLDEGAGEVPRESVDLLMLSKEVADRLQTEAQKKNLQIIVSGDSASIPGIPHQIREIVYNLCDNAIRYNKENGKVEISVQNLPNAVVLQVMDTGIGIAAEHHSRIFERFYCVNKSHSKETGGTGLGLSIVKHAAQIHGATVELQSEVGLGTTMTVRFPKPGSSLNV